jgi:hypothetical protein
MGSYFTRPSILGVIGEAISENEMEELEKSGNRRRDRGYALGEG